jgi:hypothetical protein
MEQPLAIAWSSRSREARIEMCRVRDVPGLYHRWVPPLPLYFLSKSFAFIGIREGIRPIFLIPDGLKLKYLESSTCGAVVLVGDSHGPYPSSLSSLMHHDAPSEGINRQDFGMYF